MFNVQVGAGIAFLAGLASFLAPCVLPLVPAYLSYLSGHALTKPAEEHTWQSRLFVITHAVFFVLGFSIVFIALGVAAGSVGKLLRGAWIRYLGGVVMVFFGLVLMGAVQIPLLYQEAKLTWHGKHEWGFLSSLLMGMVFAAGWTPCVGPALSAILALSASQSTAGRGAFLLAVYSAGIGIPFILAGFLVDRLSVLLQKVQPLMPRIQKVTGTLLILTGLILFTDSFTGIGHWLQERGIGWNLGL